METNKSVTSVTSGDAGEPAGRRPAARAPTALDDSTPTALRSAAADLASSAEQLYRVGDAFLERQARERPYAVLGTATGVGFVLGGGLAWRMAGTLANVLGRLAITRAVDGWLTSAVTPAPTGQSSRSRHSTQQEGSRSQ